MEKEDYKRFFQKSRGKKGTKHNYFTLTIHLCMFVIVAKKLPTCLLVRQDITQHKEYKADCCTGKIFVFFSG